MTIYKNKLTTEYNLDIGEHVGCALDRLEREVSEYEIQIAIEFYRRKEKELKKEAINEIREAIKNHIIENSKA